MTAGPGARGSLFLAAELQRGQRSTFSSTYRHYRCLPGGRIGIGVLASTGGFGEDDWRDVGCDASPALSAWPPTAQRCAAMRVPPYPLRTKPAAATASPAAGGGSSSGGSSGSSGGGGSTPVSFRDFSWATAICGSRAFRVRGGRQQRRWRQRSWGHGEVAAHHSLVNHAPWAQRGLATRRRAKEKAPSPEAATIPTRVALCVAVVGCRRRGDRGLLLREGLSNERLLLEYGLPSGQPPR